MELELKWLKRLRRRWLRKQVVKIVPDWYKRPFDWIYDAPYTQWRLRLWCVKTTRGVRYEDLFEWITEQEEQNNQSH